MKLCRSFRRESPAMPFGFSGRIICSGSNSWPVIFIRLWAGAPPAMSERQAMRLPYNLSSSVHASASLSFLVSAGFCAANDFSPEIFSCNFIRPSSNASGRGGQPEM